MLPVNLYPLLTAALLPGPAPLSFSQDMSERCNFPVIRYETRLPRRPNRADAVRLACTLQGDEKGRRRRAHARHAVGRAAVVKRLLVTTLSFGPPPQDESGDGLHGVWHKEGELHRLWMPRPLGDALDAQRRWMPCLALVLPCVV